MSQGTLVTTARVTGKPDVLTDVLKQLLFQYEPQTVAELLPQVQTFFPVRQPEAKLEKNIQRCLKKNPAFEEDAQGLWFLNLKGGSENDAVYRLLEKEKAPLNIEEINKFLAERIDEKGLAYDGRFFRLKNGKWALTHWELIRELGEGEGEKIAQKMRQRGAPLPLFEIKNRVLAGPWEEGEIESYLREDSRFLEVGGKQWFLKKLVPSPPVKLKEAPLPSLRQAELDTLQGAELMLTFQDTGPQVRSYILSSADLENGWLRLTKHLEEIFSSLPPVSFLTFRTFSGPVEAWYYQEARLITGFGEWFSQQGLEAGKRFEIRKVGNEEAIYDLVDTGLREEEVYAEAQRLQALQKLKISAADLRREELLIETFKLFPAGLELRVIQEVVSFLLPQEHFDLEETLRSFPFFEEVAGGVWIFSPTMKATYDEVRRELAETQQMLAVAQAEVKKVNLSQAQMEHLIKKNEELETENAELKKEIEKLLLRKEQLRVELNQREGELSQLRLERDALQSRVEQLEGRNLQLQGSLNNFLGRGQTEQAALKQKSKDLEKRLQGVLLANQELQHNIAHLQEECFELRRKLAPWLVRMAVFFAEAFSLRRRQEKRTSAAKKRKAA